MTVTVTSPQRVPREPRAAASISRAKQYEPLEHRAPGSLDVKEERLVPVGAEEGRDPGAASLTCETACRVRAARVTCRVCSVVALSLRFCAFTVARGLGFQERNALPGPPERNRLTIVSPATSIPPILGRHGLVGAPAGFGFFELVTSFCSLRVLEAWAEARLLLHDDARLESIAARGVAGPDATIEATRFAMSGNVYAVRDFEVEALGAETALVRASISYTGEEDVPVLTSVRWLVSGRDGLIWRAAIVASRPEAERLLREEGPGLGL